MRANGRGASVSFRSGFQTFRKRVQFEGLTKIEKGSSSGFRFFSRKRFGSGVRLGSV